MKLVRGVLGAVIGAVPGVILVLLAQFVIEGEMQLTVGAPGILLAAVGGIAGFAVGWRRTAREPGDA
jgi:hypothetical protein